VRDDNFSQAELDKFNELAPPMVGSRSPQKALHALNPARLGYVAGRYRCAVRRCWMWLRGGLLSEALAREGAQGDGDRSGPDLIRIAKLHRLESGVDVEYRLVSAEGARGASSPAATDAITCMEMLEHVPDPASVLVPARILLKPAGACSCRRSIARPLHSRWPSSGPNTSRALLPKGTHQYRDFIKARRNWPAGCVAKGMQLEDVSGLV
jgi:2-polyprenyl-6-hydroxyphenyl methylase/3-demethylubiquinone-9 3-methyltransferase